MISARPRPAAMPAVRTARRSPRRPLWLGFQALRMDSRFCELPIAARVLWVEIFAAAHRRHYAGRLPFDDTRQVALAIGAPLGVVRLHLDRLRAAGLLREVSGGLVAECSAWPS